MGATAMTVKRHLAQLCAHVISASVFLNYATPALAQAPAGPVFSLKRCSPLPEGMQMHGSAAAPAHDALFATVSRDGTLGAWTHSAPFPDLPRSNLATCSSDQNLFLCGGNNGNVINDTVLAAQFAPDGTPSNWRIVGKLPT